MSTAPFSGSSRRSMKKGRNEIKSSLYVPINSSTELFVVCLLLMCAWPPFCHKSCSANSTGLDEIWRRMNVLLAYNELIRFCTWTVRSTKVDETVMFLRNVNDNVLCVHKTYQWPHTVCNTKIFFSFWIFPFRLPATLFDVFMKTCFVLWISVKWHTKLQRFVVVVMVFPKFDFSTARIPKLIFHTKKLSTFASTWHFYPGLHL